MAGNGRSLGPKGFLTEEEKQNMPKVTKEKAQGFKATSEDDVRISFAREI